MSFKSKYLIEENDKGVHSTPEIISNTIVKALSQKENHLVYDGDFYLRSDPECKKLSTKEANEYIKQNFKEE